MREARVTYEDKQLVLEENGCALTRARFNPRRNNNPV
jgi:hypothetical protein